MKNWNFRSLTRNTKLIIILGVGLLNGLLYVFITPSWWHHDEPGHFQIVRFIVDYGRWPDPGEYDEDVQEELKLSLDEHGIFDYINYSMDSVEEPPPWVLAPQIKDPPLYYIAASVPLRIFENASVDFQNRVLRLLSLVFFLLTLWVSWEFGKEIFGESHPLGSAPTVFLAMLPGFLNEMTAISNTTLGTLLFSFFLLMGVKLLKNGFSWLRISLFVGSAIASYYTNNLVWVSIALITPGVILFLIFAKRLKWIPWAIIFSVAVVVPLSLFEWGEARYWYGDEPIKVHTRVLDEASPYGDYVLALPGSYTIRQRIPQSFLKPLRSKRMTLGFWAWASTPTDVVAPQVIFSVENEHFSYAPQRISINATPNFYTIQIEIPQNSGRGWLRLSPNVDQNISVYFDQIVLVEGMTYDGIPQLGDTNGKTGTWQGQPFTNLMRNASFENAWFTISADAWNKLFYRFQAYFSSPALVTLLDSQSSGWYSKQTFGVLSETFWGKFGPSTVSILGAPYLYHALRVILLLSIVGAALFVWKKKAVFNKPIIFILGLSLFVVWGQAFLRGAGSVDRTYLVIPWARYALPAFMPTAMLLCTGWFSLFTALADPLKLDKEKALSVFGLAFLLCLDIFSILTMLHFFYSQTNWPYFALFLLLSVSLILVFYERIGKIYEGG